MCLYLKTMFVKDTNASVGTAGVDGAPVLGHCHGGDGLVVAFDNPPRFVAV